ncbi:MAG: adenylate kinase family protein [Salinirussus sp.]
MRMAVTGTPGTGKTSSTDRVSADLGVVHLNDLIRSESLTTGWDESRDSLVADIEAVADRLAGREDVVIESHLAHRIAVDRVAVLRCHPDSLTERLTERGEPPGTVEENAESEALDVILVEAVERHGPDRVYEVDTTDRTVADVATELDAIAAGEREPGVGTVSFLDYV